MGKVASRVSQALGLSAFNPANNPANFPPPAQKPPQWDTTIDQLFGDAPPDDNVLASTPSLDEPIRPRRRRRRAPPPPPSLFSENRRRRLPSSPSSQRRNRQRRVHAIRTPVVPDMPRRVAQRRVHAPVPRNRRTRHIAAPVRQQDVPVRLARSSSLKRQPSFASSRRRTRPSSQRNERLQELLQCPVCLTPYIQPRLLPCGHTYCHDCLDRLVQNADDVITCPECRKEHLIPDEGVFPPNFIVRRLLENGSFHQDRRLKHSSGKHLRFYIAVRKITRSHSQVKRLTIEMPMGNYLRDPCETLIRRIADREQLESPTHQLVLEFGDKRLRPQRTLASYGVQNGDLLFLFNPEQRLSFLAYDDDDEGNAPPPPPPPLPNTRDTSRLRTNSYNSSASDIRTTTSTDMSYNRMHHPLSPISDQDGYGSSLYSDT